MFGNKYLLALMLPVVLAGCASGGGTSAPISPTNPTNPSVPTTPNPPQTPSPTPESFETSEYFLSGALASVHASSAYAAGASGVGVKVAVVDSGVDSTHPQLSGQVDISNSFDMVNGSGVTGTSADDPFGHGTHVAGIIAAKRDGSLYHGVAPDAKIISIRMLDSIGSSSATSIADSWMKAGGSGAKIINNSWGSPGSVISYPASVMRSSAEGVAAANLVAGGAVMVFSAGNESAADPSIFPAMPYVMPELEKGWLAVASLDAAAGQLANYSNKCGIAASWCITAPGTYILSSSKNGTDAYMSGTSMAAPVVSGSLALLTELFPTLTAQQLRERILFTANKSGVFSDAATYGQGLLDLSAASQPVGGLSLPTGPTVNGSVTSRALSVSGSSYGSLMNTLSAKEVVMVDGFQRAPFSVLASQIVSVTDDVKKLTVRAGQPEGEEKKISTTSSLSFANVSLSSGQIQSQAVFRSMTDGFGLVASLNARPSSVDLMFSSKEAGAPSASGLFDFVGGGELSGYVPVTGISLLRPLGSGVGFGFSGLSSQYDRKVGLGLHKDFGGGTASVEYSLNHPIGMTDGASSLPSSSRGSDVSLVLQGSLSNDFGVVSKFSLINSNAVSKSGMLSASSSSVRRYLSFGAYGAFAGGWRGSVAIRSNLSARSDTTLTLPTSVDSTGKIYYEQVSGFIRLGPTLGAAIFAEKAFSGGSVLMSLQRESGATSANLELKKLF